MKVLAFDPGGMTGWCVIDSERGLMASGEFRDWQGMKDKVNEYEPDVIVYEIFRLYAWKAQCKSWDTFVEIEAIGVLKFLAQELEIPCVGQNPAERKFFTDEKLKANDMFPCSKHAADAVRHGLFYLQFGRHRKAKK